MALGQNAKWMVAPSRLKKPFVFQKKAASIYPDLQNDKQDIHVFFYLPPPSHGC